MASLAINSFKAVCDKLNSEASTASLPDVAKVYAKMSDEAYIHKNHRENEIGGFEYLKGKGKSDELVGLYYLRRKNLYVIAIKGSSKAKEWLTDDGRIVLGETAFRKIYSEKFTTFLRKHCPELKGTLTHTIELFQNLEKQRFWAKDAKIHVTGHSLGGWVAIELAKKFKNKISGGHVFNAGSSPVRKVLIPYFLSSAWAEFTEDRVSHGTFHHHHIKLDILSTGFEKLGPNQTTEYNVCNLVNCRPDKFHEIKNFSNQYDPNAQYSL